MTQTTITKKTPEDYIGLPYHLVLVEDESEDGEKGWFAEVEELRGCMSQGRTPEEAVENLRDAMLGWISIALEDGKAIPEPRAETDYSGRLLLRMPKSLHATAAERARHEDVSLNHFIVYALAATVGLSPDHELV
jgi:antitoxin HicB